MKAVKPDSEIWVLWGDGSCTYSLAEIEPSVRHNLPFIAIIGKFHINTDPLISIKFYSRNIKMVAVY